MKSYILQDQILINTPARKVWEVLINPEYISQWDDIPEDYDGGRLKPGSVLEWEGHAVMTVTGFEVEHRLCLNLFLPSLGLLKEQYQVDYVYFLREHDGHTILDIHIGDFAPLPGPDKYLEASEDFLKTALPKIKELAEGIIL